MNIQQNNVIQSKILEEFVPTCSICFDEVLNDDNSQLLCKHDFHLYCIKNLRNNACPLCRSPLNSPKLSSEDISKIENNFKKDKMFREGYFTTQRSSFFQNDNESTMTDILENLRELGDSLEYIIFLELRNKGFYFIKNITKNVKLMSIFVCDILFKWIILYDAHIFFNYKIMSIIIVFCFLSLSGMSQIYKISKENENLWCDYAKRNICDMYIDCDEIIVDRILRNGYTTICELFN